VKEKILDHSPHPRDISCYAEGGYVNKSTCIALYITDWCQYKVNKTAVDKPQDTQQSGPVTVCTMRTTGAQRNPRK